MHPIYMQSDDHFQVFTTVFSPQVCRSRTRTKRKVEEEKVVAAMNYRPHGEDELELRHGDVIQVLFKEDRSWWFGRLQNGNEGYFPSACVDRCVSDEEPSEARPSLLRRCSVPVVVINRDPPCGSTGGRSTPKLPRKDSIRRAPGHDRSSVTGGTSAHNPPSLLHRVLSRSRRMSCPHLPHTLHPGTGSINTLHPGAGSINTQHPGTGSINTAFQPD